MVPRDFHHFSQKIVVPRDSFPVENVASVRFPCGDFQFMREMSVLARFSAFPAENVVSARFPVSNVQNEFCSARFAIFLAEKDFRSARLASLLESRDCSAGAFREIYLYIAEVSRR